MARPRTEKNKTQFRRDFFLLAAQQSLTQCEYKCLLVLCEGVEQTMSMVADILKDSRPHVCNAMKRLTGIGIIEQARTEGRNIFYRLNLTWKPTAAEDKDQLKLPIAEEK